MHCLYNTPDKFQAGNISNHFENWNLITSDKYLLEIVKNGYSIEFHSMPVLSHLKCNNKFNSGEILFISAEIDKLLTMSVLTKTTYSPEQYVSGIFLRPKKDGTYRLILNLKGLNESVEKHHFKMETLKTAINLVKQNCYFASIDFAQAYDSVPIAEHSRKYLCFIGKVKFTNSHVYLMAFLQPHVYLQNYLNPCTLLCGNWVI
jgi:hypothetical protein